MDQKHRHRYDRRVTHTFRSQLELSRRFDGLRSLCSTLDECMYFKARRIYRRAVVRSIDDDGSPHTHGKRVTKNGKRAPANDKVV